MTLDNDTLEAWEKDSVLNINYGENKQTIEWSHRILALISELKNTREALKGHIETGRQFYDRLQSAEEALKQLEAIETEFNKNGIKFIANFIGGKARAHFEKFKS